jgi:TonB family protein
VKIIKSSGSDALDRAAVNAVKKVNVFPLPENQVLVDREFRSIHMGFISP